MPDYDQPVPVSSPTFGLGRVPGVQEKPEAPVLERVAGLEHGHEQQRVVLDTLICDVRRLAATLGIQTSV